MHLPDATINKDEDSLLFHFALTFSHYSSNSDFNGLAYTFNYSNEIPYNVFYFFNFFTYFISNLFKTKNI